MTLLFFARPTLADFSIGRGFLGVKYYRNTVKYIDPSFCECNSPSLVPRPHDWRGDSLVSTTCMCMTIPREFVYVCGKVDRTRKFKCYSNYCLTCSNGVCALISWFGFLQYPSLCLYLCVTLLTV